MRLQGKDFFVSAVLGIVGAMKMTGTEAKETLRDEVLVSFYVLDCEVIFGEPSF